MEDVLTQFKDYWLANRPLNVNLDAYSRVASHRGAILFRDRQFQVQLFVCDPDTDIGDHLHPNVDSYEVIVGGNVHFRIHGEYLPDDAPPVQRVFPNDWHGGKIGKEGAVFLSIQHWLNDIKPTSVHHDWDGKPLDDKHVILSGLNHG